MKISAKIKSSSDQAATLLRRAIICGDIKPGEKLREMEISEAMGVSRSPIREAFRVLESEGLVHIETNKGATVTNQLKEAVCEGGAKIRVPPFVENGVVIKVDTRTGEYLGRA